MTQTEYRHLQVEEVQGVTIATITLKNFLDDTAVQEFEEDLLALANSDMQKLILNFQDLTYWRAVVNPTLLEMHKVLIGRGIKIALCEMHENVYAVFEMTRMTNLFTVITPTLREAVRWLAM